MSDETVAEELERIKRVNVILTSENARLGDGVWAAAMQTRELVDALRTADSCMEMARKRIATALDQLSKVPEVPR
jgi:hypothetical protein